MHNRNVPKYLPLFAHAAWAWQPASKDRPSITVRYFDVSKRSIGGSGAEVEVLRYRETGRGGDNGPQQAAPNTLQEPQSPRRQPQDAPELPDISSEPTPPRSRSFGEVGCGWRRRPASQAELSRQMHEWSIHAEQALRSAQACGHAPAGMERPLEQSRQSAQDWRAIVRDFVMATNPSDYRWAPPNRRFISLGLYLPSVERSGMGYIVIAVDTSGSIGIIKELEQFAGEINKNHHGLLGNVLSALRRRNLECQRSEYPSESQDDEPSPFADSGSNEIPSGKNASSLAPVPGLCPVCIRCCPVLTGRVQR